MSAPTTSGEAVLEPGCWIGPNEIAILASLGYADVAVAAWPCIEVISTGDELVEVEV